MKKNIFARFAVQATSWLTPIRFRSLRIRLALWALLLLGVSQVMVSFILVVAISSWLENQVNDNLILTANQVASVLYDPEDTQNPLDIADAGLKLADTNIATQSFLRDKLFFVRLVDVKTHNILADSADYHVPTTQVDVTGFSTVGFLEDDDVDEIRLYNLRLSYLPQVALQVGVSLEETREIQADVIRILIILLAFTGTLAPVSGWFLANRALVPIRATVRTAARISAMDLSQRLDMAASEVELAQLVETFNAMLERIDRAFQQQRQFTADAAHELRTPLSIMQIGLDVTLGQSRSPEEYRSALVSIREEVQRLSQLANTLLMFARADGRESSLAVSEVDLSLMLNTVVDQFEVAAEEKHIQLSRQIAPCLNLKGDEDRLVQVLYNLIDNAVKYAPDGGKVCICAESVGQSIEIIVEDNGPGIPDTEQARIFDRFYRVEASRSRDRGGFGLGLAIAKQTVDLHGGTIRVVSVPGQGAQFIVVLPVDARRSGRDNFGLH